MSYGTVHKRLLVTLMNFGVMTEVDVMKWLAEHFGNEDHELSDLIHEINGKIRPMKQQIKSTVNEYNGNKEIVFISFGDDEASRAQNLFPPADLEYFKFLLDEIILSNEKTITGISALNLTSKVKIGTVSKSHAQELLDYWVRTRFFRQGINGEYSLDTRGIHEFHEYFQKNFTNTLDKCVLCSKNIFQVPNECPYCGEFVHSYCLRSYVEKISKWPCCKKIYESDP